MQLERSINLNSKCMKKTLKNLVEKLILNDQNSLSGGFRSIRGGSLANNQSCRNDYYCPGNNTVSCTNSLGGTCSGTNSGTTCANDGSCGHSTNTFGTTCNNQNCI